MTTDIQTTLVGAVAVTCTNCGRFVRHSSAQMNRTFCGNMCEEIWTKKLVEVANVTGPELKLELMRGNRMTLKEAIESNKPFKRLHSIKWMRWSDDVTLPFKDAVATDWIVKNDKTLFTKQDVQRAVAKAFFLTLPEGKTPPEVHFAQAMDAAEED